MSAVLGVLFGVLVVLAVARLYLRWTAGRGANALTDDMIRDIEREGRLEQDEPLDLDEIAREERRFLEETWDEPEEF